MDGESCGVYADWLNWLRRYNCSTSTRDGETVEERMKKVDGFEGLPRIGLDYW